MGLIKLNNIEDFTEAVRLIEEYNTNSVKVIKYIGKPSHIQPNLTKQYTEYDDVELTIEADWLVIDVMDSYEINYRTP